MLPRRTARFPKPIPPSYDARYHDQNDNVFIQTQQRPVLDEGTQEPMSNILYSKLDLFPIYQALGAPEVDVSTDPESAYLFQFFMQQVRQKIGFHRIFPTIFATMVAHSITNEGLRFMVLAVSSFVMDTIKSRPQLRSYRYLQQAIPRIQGALASGDFDDGLVYSVLLAVYLHILGGENASARRHLEGLRLLLARYSVSPSDFGSSEMPPEMMFIVRMAIRFDQHWSFGDTESIFPLLPQTDDERRVWVQRLTNYSKPETTEWALAQFALDDLVSRAIAINKRAMQLRSAAGPDDELTEGAIQRETAKLLEEHQAWNERSYVKTATELADADQLARDPDEELLDDDKFLDYPPLKFTDKWYGAIRAQYHWLLIYFTFITHPQPGPYPYERFQAAIDFCRTFASVGWSDACNASRPVLGLYLTGLTLGEPTYPRGMILD